ncbi:hypothetical protein [Parasitella parasitica]|uniref:Uncharacterized protein n=1 Tax=Parasitella parasitica TaxID=35722 RepID=A0A0B7NAA4_9FUNG|nr:hypothetical protein [Parasitella parasitica]
MFLQDFIAACVVWVLLRFLVDVALPAPRMPLLACVGLLGVLDFNVVTFLGRAYVCSGCWCWAVVLWPRLLLGLAPDGVSLAGNSLGAPGATAASPGLVCLALPPAAFAVEPGAEPAPAKPDVVVLEPAAVVDLCSSPSASSSSSPVGLAIAPPPVIAEAVKPAATVESEDSVDVSAGVVLAPTACAVLSPPADAVLSPPGGTLLLSSAPFSVDLPAASCPTPVGLPVCAGGGPCRVVPLVEKIRPSVCPRVGNVFKKSLPCKPRRLVRKDLVVPSLWQEPMDVIVDAVLPGTCSVVSPSPAACFFRVAPDEGDSSWSGPVAVASTATAGKKCSRSCCARLRGFSPRSKRCARRGGRCWRQAGCVEVGAVPRLPAAGHVEKRVPRAVAVRRLRRGAKELLATHAASVAEAIKKARVVFAAFVAAKQAEDTRAARAAASLAPVSVAPASVPAAPAPLPAAPAPLSAAPAPLSAAPAPLSAAPAVKAVSEPIAAKADEIDAVSGGVKAGYRPPALLRPVSVVRPASFARPGASKPRSAGGVSRSVAGSGSVSSRPPVAAAKPCAGKKPPAIKAAANKAAASSDAKAAIAARPIAIPHRRRPEGASKE